VRTILLAIVLVVFATPATAQTTVPPGSLAFTTCIGGHIKTYVDAELIGTDSMQEILVHEAKHREQARRLAPNCPAYTAWKLLTDEVEAYCASRPYRMARSSNKDTAELEANVNYLTRLFYQFKGAMPRHDIVRAYRTGCPDSSVFQLEH